MGKASKQEANRLKKVKKRKLVDIFIATEYVPEMVKHILKTCEEKGKEPPTTEEELIDLINLFDRYIQSKRKELL